MVAPVFSQGILSLPCFEKYTISKAALRISQAALGILAVFNTGVLLEGCIRHNVSPWVYPVSCAAIGLSFVGTMVTLCFKPVVSVARKTPLLNPAIIASLHLTPLIHELCEMDLEGKPKPCTIERMQEILTHLENESALHTLNTIPEYELSKQCWPTLPPTRYTPLQHWASLGNLPAVQLLVKYGAVDYPEPEAD